MTQFSVGQTGLSSVLQRWENESRLGLAVGKLGEWGPVMASEQYRSRIERYLHFDLNHAREHLSVATERFDAWAAIVESETKPSPDMLIELKRLDLERSRATAEFHKALSRFNDFVIGGILPEEFR